MKTAHFQFPRSIWKAWVPWSLLCIVLCAAVLRFWNLGGLPVGLNRDESALAYNAFLLQQTGTDEWQQRWPLALKSFGDYKLPGYVWAIIGSFDVFGYSDAAVRYPSALAGAVLPLIVFLFATRVLKWKPAFALLAAATVAVLPVSIFYSRFAFEANLSLTLFLISLTAFFDQRSAPSVKKDLVGTVFLLLAVLTYNTPLLLLPFVMVLLILIRGPRQPKKWLGSVAGMLLVAILGFALLQSVAAQKSAITIFSDETTKLAANEYHNSFHGLSQKVLGSKWVYFGQLIAKNYFATFSKGFLVEQGGHHPWHQLPGFAHLTWMTYLFAFAGIDLTLLSVFRTLRKKQWPKIEVMMLGLLLVSPLPAAITVDAPHATRSLLFFLFFALFAVEGVRRLLDLPKFSIAIQKAIRVSLVVSAVIFVWQTGAYIHAYFQNYPAQSAVILQDGFAWEVQRAAGGNPHDTVAVVDPDGFQYIATAWDLRMPPETFFSTINHHLPDRIGFQYGYKVGQFRFVVSPNDRFPEEKQLIQWDERAQKWQTQKF